jgi:uncharacterized protein YbcI
MDDLPREKLVEIADAMAQIKSTHFGKGPASSRAYAADDYVFVVMRGGLTEAEKTMLAGGEEDLVRRWRLRFQELTRDKFTGAVEKATGREVVDYHSQLLAPSETVVEMFILTPDGDAPD